MAVPSYDRFIEPILRFLANHPEGVAASAVHEAAADTLELSEDDRAEQLSSGQARYKNRAGWAHDRLKRAGLSDCPRRGHWQLTEKGVDYARLHPAPLPPEVLSHLVADYQHVRLQPSSSVAGEKVSASESPSTIGEVGAGSPDDRLESALVEIQATVTSELLDLLAQCSPRFFEGFVLDLLHGLGYGTNRNALKRVGGSGDGGIDGIISLDRLGLEKVYVQAKRWQNPVGRPEIQSFYGALAGQRATKGVFVTTSTYTPQAIDFAEQVEKIVLVDGQQLAKHAIEAGIGFSYRTIRIPKIDSDYFED